MNRLKLIGDLLRAPDPPADIEPTRADDDRPRRPALCRPPPPFPAISEAKPPAKPWLTTNDVLGVAVALFLVIGAGIAWERLTRPDDESWRSADPGWICDWSERSE